MLTDMPALGLCISNVPDSQGRIALLSGACLETLLLILTVNGQVHQSQCEKGTVTGSPNSSGMRINIPPYKKPPRPTKLLAKGEEHIEWAVEKEMIRISCDLKAS